MKAGKFELFCLVGGVALPEMVNGEGVTFVESRFNVAGVTYKVESLETDPWGEEYTQSWPVTPYTLSLVNNSGDMVYVNVFIDGSPATSQYCAAGHNEIKGFRDTSGKSAASREFLFTPPRRLKKGENPEPEFNAVEKTALKAQLESIRVEVLECKFNRSEERFCAGTAATGVAKGVEAVNKAVAKAADAASATCAGREIAGKATKSGNVKYNIYDIAKTPCQELLMRYSQRRKLENLGLLEPDEASGERKAVARPRKGAAAAAPGGAGGRDDDEEKPFTGKKARLDDEEEAAPIDLS